MPPAEGISTGGCSAASTSPLPGSSPSAGPAPAAQPPTVEIVVEEVAPASATPWPNTTAAVGALPALPALPAPGEGDGDNTVIEVNGAAVALDKLGPMVIGRDGTVSRIANWGEMTDIERRNTLRILGKRNQLRLANLRGENNGSNASSST